MQIRAWFHFFFARLVVVVAAWLMFEVSKVMNDEKLGVTHHRVGHLRRASILRDEFPSGLEQPWLCDFQRRTAGPSRLQGLEEFLDAWTCTWDTKHYIWLAGEFLLYYVRKFYVDGMRRWQNLAMTQP